MDAKLIFQWQRLWNNVYRGTNHNILDTECVAGPETAYHCARLPEYLSGPRQ